MCSSPVGSRADWAFRSPHGPGASRSAIAADIRLTRTGATLGTVAYMSPEQAQGKPVDARTDVWSLGVMLYEMLTGQLPFGGETEGLLVHAIIYRPAKPLCKADPAIPAEIERVVLRALEKKPEDRYRTMADFLSDLESLAEGLKPLKAGSRLFRGRVLGVRKPVFYAAAIGLIAVAAFIVFKFLIPSAQAGVLDSVAILPIINESGDAGRDYFAKGLTRELNTELYKVAAVKVAITPEEQKLLAGGRKVNPKAYDLLLKGIAFALPADGALGDDQKGDECFRKALDIDPDLAMAHAWLAFTDFGRGINQYENPKVIYPRAWEALEKVLVLDERLAMAHAVRGYLKAAMNWD
ncbi:MAG: hypothetical protein FJY81_06780, partial [Candidatus Aminicenantes bacterium]|nr:hypothetical protein [Candidatus Aminicenantes bacterium]